jgi:hypothetical protein
MRSFGRLWLCAMVLLGGSCSSGWYTQPGETTAAATADAGQRQCQVEGRWVGMIPGGPLAGRPLELTFYQGGMARGTSGVVVLDQSWQQNGDVVSIDHVNAIPPAAACPAGVVGRYTLSFGADCNSVQAVSIEDGCEHRRRTLSGLQARRQ